MKTAVFRSKTTVFEQKPWFSPKRSFYQKTQFSLPKTMVFDGVLQSWGLGLSSSKVFSFFKRKTNKFLFFTRIAHSIFVPFTSFVLYRVVRLNLLLVSRCKEGTGWSLYSWYIRTHTLTITVITLGKGNYLTWKKKTSSLHCTTVSWSGPIQFVPIILYKSKNFLYEAPCPFW